MMQYIWFAALIGCSNDKIQEVEEESYKSQLSLFPPAGGLGTTVDVAIEANRTSFGLRDTTVDFGDESELSEEITPGNFVIHDYDDEGGGDDACFADASGAQLMTAVMIMTAGTDETTGRMYLIVGTSASSRPPSFPVSPLMMR